MKPYLLDRTDLQNRSVSVHHNQYPHFLKVWHYHEQLELVLILKSKGTRFVGDSIEKFNEGEVILLGKNLPHMWLNDKEYFEKGSDLVAEAIAVHFKEDFLGTEFFSIPEMKHIHMLFEKAKRGLKFNVENKKISDEIKELIHLNDVEKIVKMIRILDLLARENSCARLSTSGFVTSFQITKNKKLASVYSYIFNNFKNQISLDEVADVAHMNPSAFSRYFKKMSRKTFSRYLNEIRVGYSCKLLLEEKYSMTDICYTSGFNNISNFNRQFKEITDYSPTEYLKNHLKAF